MPHVKDVSVGVIPIHIQEDGTKLFCLVRHAKGHWGFPKGHPDNNESPEDTARRELEEETGITVVRLDVRHPFAEKYSFRYEVKSVDKEVAYFVGYVDSIEDKTPQSFKSEIPETRWLGIIETRDLLTYDQAKRLLGDIWIYLESGA